LIIRYLKVEDAPAHDFWPTFLPQYLLTDIRQGFSQNPRHIHSRDNGIDPKMTREVAGLYDHLIVACAHRKYPDLDLPIDWT
jgi:hypothetical protein